MKGRKNNDFENYTNVFARFTHLPTRTVRECGFYSVLALAMSILLTALEARIFCTELVQATANSQF